MRIWSIYPLDTISISPIKLETWPIQEKQGKYVKDRPIWDSSNLDSGKTRPIWVFNILNAILKMLSILYTKIITLLKIQQVTPIGLRRCCPEWDVNQCYRLLYTTSAHDILLKWKSLKAEHY